MKNIFRQSQSTIKSYDEEKLESFTGNSQVMIDFYFISHWEFSIWVTLVSFILHLQESIFSLNLYCKAILHIYYFKLSDYQTFLENLKTEISKKVNKTGREREKWRKRNLYTLLLHHSLDLLHHGTLPLTVFSDLWLSSSWLADKNPTRPMQK